MGKQKAFYDKDYRSHFGATIFFVCTFICFALCTIGTPMGMLMIHSAYPADATDPAGKNPCYTLWGAQSECLATTYSWRIIQEKCTAKLRRWEFAEAFSIIAIFSLFFQFFGLWLQIDGNQYKIPLLILSGISIVSTIIPFAIVSSFYNTEFCGDNTLTSKNTSLGNGYALLLSSFCLQVVGTIVFVLLEPGRVIKKRSWLDDDMLEEPMSQEANGHS